MRAIGPGASPNQSSLPRHLRFLAMALCVLLGFLDTVFAVDLVRFRRGDGNQDGSVDLSDATTVFAALFLASSTPPPCQDALDSNDDGDVDLSDGLAILNFLFSGLRPLADPGPARCGHDPTEDSLSCDSYPVEACDPAPVSSRDVGHTLNRLAYGPSPADLEWIQDIGLEEYISLQLNPADIDESDNVEWISREEELLRREAPTRSFFLVELGDVWRYLKGITAPPVNWVRVNFDDSTWTRGPTGIGYGDDDDLTVLTDMKDNYVSLFMRKVFVVDDPLSIDDLVLRVNYDDAFVAYINNTEVARANINGLPGIPPSHLAIADESHEAFREEEFDLTARKGLLTAGENVLCLQVHNDKFDSTDLTIQPELFSRRVVGPERLVIDGIDALRELPHVRGVYSRRQLQAVLAEFWENHFTTQYDKVADYFNGLQNVRGVDAMPRSQAAQEAAQVEFQEYQFFYDNALGNFGDLLLYSATSPSMLIYLDNVLNVKSEPNENYAREFLELSSLGVDNRYTQTDIEELARCFTGWTACKVGADEIQSFPLSATNPPTECGQALDDRTLVALGGGWRYFKGRREPSPDLLGDATTAWTQVGFNDSDPTVWLPGLTGIGYGDDGNVTQVDDMREQYTSLYLRRQFFVADPESVRNLVFRVAYDDGLIAYLNGVEITRTPNLMPLPDRPRTPPTFDDVADESHDVTEGEEFFNLSSYVDVVRAGTNVLAIQVHNWKVSSSDLSVRPVLIDRGVVPGSVGVGDSTGEWTFGFDPAQHDQGAKTLFAGTPYEIQIPAGRVGSAGVRDALDVIDRIVDHPSSAEFICIKLLQRFASDEISLAAFKAAPTSIPTPLRATLAEMIAAWNSTTPKGNIRAVLEAMIDTQRRSTVFWDDLSYRAKVKSPVEYVNSSMRALGGVAIGRGLAHQAATMGMHLFTRADPDGWPELGSEWVDTNSMLARIEFVRSLAANDNLEFGWGPLDYLESRDLSVAEDIVEHFNDFLFDGTLSVGARAPLIQFLETDEAGNDSPLDNLQQGFQLRIEDFAGLLLSMPQWYFN